MKNLLIFILLLSPFTMLSVPPDSLKVAQTFYSISADAEGAYVFSSIIDEIRKPLDIPVEDRSHLAGSFFIKAMISLNNPRVRNYFPGGYQGIGTGVMLFENPEGTKRSSASLIGTPVMLYLFQGGPVKHLSSNLSLNYEWQFGASFGWKPWSIENATFNLTVGSRVNAYMNLRLLLNWKVSDRINLQGGISVSHFSNGNTSWPNPGINMFGLRAGMVCDISPRPEKREILPALPDSVKMGSLSYDITLWAAPRKRVFKGGDDPVLLRGHYICAGIGFAPMFHMGRWWRLGPSLDLQWDESSDLKDNYVSGTTTEDILFTRPAFLRQTSCGLSAHAELAMPVFSLNLGIGYNLYAPHENRGTYQNITLKTYLGKKFFINIGYQLRNFHQQSSLMLGAGLTL